MGLVVGSSDGRIEMLAILAHAYPVSIFLSSLFPDPTYTGTESIRTAHNIYGRNQIPHRRSGYGSIVTT